MASLLLAAGALGYEKVKSSRAKRQEAKSTASARFSELEQENLERHQRLLHNQICTCAHHHPCPVHPPPPSLASSTLSPHPTGPRSHSSPRVSSDPFRDSLEVGGERSQGASIDGSRRGGERVAVGGLFEANVFGECGREREAPVPSEGGLGGSRRGSVPEEEVELPSEPPPEYQRLAGGNTEGVVEGQREVSVASADAGAGNGEEKRKRGRSFGKKLFGRKVSSVEGAANGVVR